MARKFRKPNRKYTDEDYKKVVEYFKNNSDNRSQLIADKFGYKRHYVDRMITKYLDEKNKN